MSSTEPERVEATEPPGAGAPPAASPPAAAPAPPALAIAALVMGLVGMTCLPGSGGLVAIVLALLARSEARGTEPRPRLALANVGLVLGTVSVLGTVVGLVWLFAFMQQSTIARATSARARPRSAVALPTATATGVPTVPPPSSGGSSAANADEAEARRTETVRIGTVVLTDLGPNAGSLTAALTEQRRTAEREERTVLLWVNGTDCTPCDGVAAALLDERVQSALAGTLLVRVDVAEFGVELAHLGIPTASVPGFARLDANYRPVDYLHGGEWDADLAVNIAPVLRSFARGDPMQRRHPWRPAGTPAPTPI